MSSKPWTDDEIRSQLLSLGESLVPITATTRPFLLKKIERLLQEDKSDGCSRTTVEESTLESSETSGGALKCDLDEQEAAPVEGYYTVVVGQRFASGEEQLCPVYTSREDALKVIKNTPGARFKKFESKDAALAHWESQRHQDRQKVVDSEDVDSSKPTSTAEKANNFPSLKTPQLNKFRKLIEVGDVQSFADSVWSNPRYLITSGDTPEILQLGCRYNALHCAVRSGKLDVCKELLRIIQGNRFWELVYPDDSDVVRQTRRDHLVDLYLNMQDKINRETPLHFACKYGHADIVAFLVSFTRTCQTIKNKYGQVPADVVCKDGNKSAKSRIVQLLQEPEIYYVPVLRSVDNSTPPQLFSPCTLPELSSQSPLLNVTGVSSPVVGHALAGPMSPSKANEFYREWRSPSQSVERKDASIVKRSDPERGLERVGRKLAHSKGVGWMEYWDFINCSCDLSHPEGQLMIEEYLKELSDSSRNLSSQDLLTVHEDGENPLLLGTPGSPGGTVARQHVFDGVPGKLFCEDGVKEVLSSDKDTQSNDDINAIVDSLADLLDKNLSFNEETDFQLSSTSDPSPDSSRSTPIFLAGSKPSKLDLDVIRALDGVDPDPSRFPYLHDWLKNVKSFSEQQQKCWRTPTSMRQRQLGTFRSAMDSSSQPISPLVFSSPSSSARRDHSLPGSSPSSNHIATTPKRQQTQTPGRYFDFRPSPHGHQQTRSVMGYRSAGTTPQQRFGSQTQNHMTHNQPRSVSQFRAPL